MSIDDIPPPPDVPPPAHESSEKHSPIVIDRESNVSHVADGRVYLASGESGRPPTVMEIRSGPGGVQILPGFSEAAQTAPWDERPAYVESIHTDPAQPGRYILSPETSSLPPFIDTVAVTVDKTSGTPVMTQQTLPGFEIPAAGQADAVLISDPHGPGADLAVAGEVVRPGGLVIVQAQAETSREFRELWDSVLGGQTPGGFELLQARSWDAPTGPPTARIVLRRISDDQAPAGAPDVSASDVLPDGAARPPAGPPSDAVARAEWPGTKDRAADPPVPTDPVGVTSAMIGNSVHDLQQIFAKQFVYDQPGQLSITTYQETKWYDEIKDDASAILNSDKLLAEVGRRFLGGETTAQAGTGSFSELVETGRKVIDREIPLPDDDYKEATKVAGPPRFDATQTIDVAIMIGHNGTLVSDSSRGALAGQPVIIVPSGLTPDVTTRQLARELGDIYAAANPGAPSGGMRELDAISLYWNRAASFAEQARGDGDDRAAQVWQTEADRLQDEFRTLAQETGIVPAADDKPARDAARANREAAWAGMSDSSRMLAVHLSPGARYPAFMPGAARFRAEYDKLDHLVYFLENVTSPADRQLFDATGFGQLADGSPGAYKVTYKTYFRGISEERPLDKATGDEAKQEVLAHRAAVNGLFSEVEAWARENGVLDRAGVTLNEAVAQGKERYRQDYERIKDQLSQIVRDFGEAHGLELGFELGFVGSMRTGSRGPHKAGVNADLHSFDLDVYIVDRDLFDLEYARIMTFAPDLNSRSKTLADRLVTPYLKQLSTELAQILASAFPENAALAESEIALRREPPGISLPHATRRP